MRIERIFREIPGFQNIALDTVLFESKYPVLFTCKNEEDIYLFICCLVDTEQIEWIGTRTTYDNLIELLENKITIREAFLNVTNRKMMVEYDGKTVKYELKNSAAIPEKFLPTAGEYMDAEDDEYREEIAEFQKRNTNTEYMIRPQISKYIFFEYKGIGTLDLEKGSEIKLDISDVFSYQMEKIFTQKIALA